MPIKKMFALQTGGITNTGCVNNNASNNNGCLRRSANWFDEGPIIKEALIGICKSKEHKYFKFRNGTLVDQEIKKGKLLYSKKYPAIESEILHCIYKGLSEPYSYIGVREDGSTNLEWEQVLLNKKNGQYHLERKSDKTVNKILQYLQNLSSNANNELIWSTNAIPQQSLKDMCIHVVTSLVGSDSIMVDSTIINNSRIELEPFAEDRDGQVLKCTFFKEKKTKKSVSVIPVIYPDKTVFVKLNNVNFVNKFASYKDPYVKEKHNNEYNKLKSTFISKYFNFAGNRFGLEKLIPLDESHLLKVLLDLKCKETMKFTADNEYLNYSYHQTLRKILVLIPNNIQSKWCFPTEFIHSNIVQCINSDLAKKGIGEAVSDWVISPFDKSVYTPVYKDHHDFYFLANGVEFHQQSLWNQVVNNDFWEQQYEDDFEVQLKYPHLKTHLIKQCSKYRGLSIEENALHGIHIQMKSKTKQLVHFAPLLGQRNMIIYQCLFQQNQELNFDGIQSQFKLYQVKEEETNGYQVIW